MCAFKRCPANRSHLIGDSRNSVTYTGCAPVAAAWTSQDKSNRMAKLSVSHWSCQNVSHVNISSCTVDVQELQTHCRGGICSRAPDRHLQQVPQQLLGPMTSPAQEVAVPQAGQMYPPQHLLLQQLLQQPPLRLAKQPPPAPVAARTHTRPAPSPSPSLARTPRPSPTSLTSSASRRLMTSQTLW